MKNHKFLSLILLTSITVTFISNASYADTDLQRQLIECADHLDDIERLTCFDALVNTSKQTSNPSISASVNVTTDNEREQQSDFNNPAENVPDTKLAQENFGKPTVSPVTMIEANLIGGFKGWNSNSVFKLDNGQVWRAVRGNATTKRLGKTLNDPKVTITKAALGSYDLRVEGVFGKLKVKRME